MNAKPNLIVRVCACPLIFSLTCSVAMAQGSSTRPDDNSDLVQQIKDMRAEMEKMKLHEEELENKLQQQSPATQPTAQQSTSAPGMISLTPVTDSQAMQNVVRDANQHSNLLSVPATISAGFDPTKGFYLASDDGNYLVHPFVLLQVRNTTSERDHEKTDGASDTENGFEIRRLQLGVDGNLFTPDFTYRVFIQANRSGGATTLFDAWVKYHLPDTSWSVEGGQFKSPLFHEQMVFDKNLMAAERTVLDDILAAGEAFSDGIMAIYDNHSAVRIKADFTNGYGINDVNFQDFPTCAANFGMGGRAEYKLIGDWKDYDQFTSEGDKDTLLVAGAGFDWTEADPSEMLHMAADIQLNCHGLGIFGGYVGRYTSHNGTNGSAGDTFDSGAVGQISYLIGNTNIEPFARYDYMNLAQREFTTRTNTNMHEITVGVNYYFHGQNAKITLDCAYLPNGSPVDDNGSGVLVSNGHAEIVGRVQFQLAL